MTDHNSNTPKESRDYWATPEWLYQWLDSIFNFDIDLAANDDNAKCCRYYTEHENSLNQDWSEGGQRFGFLNPPYSNTKPWINKSVEMQRRYFTTVQVLPTPNGESQYKAIFERASNIIYINGRIAFVASCDFIIKGKKGKPDRHIKEGDEISGNTRGTCIVVFGPLNGPPKISDVDRDEIRKHYDRKY